LPGEWSSVFRGRPWRSAHDLQAIGGRDSPVRGVVLWRLSDLAGDQTIIACCLCQHGTPLWPRHAFNNSGAYRPTPLMRAHPRFPGIRNRDRSQNQRRADEARLAEAHQEAIRTQERALISLVLVAGVITDGFCVEFAQQRGVS
jgi:hypothetical protein